MQYSAIESAISHLPSATISDQQSDIISFPSSPARAACRLSSGLTRVSSSAPTTKKTTTDSTAFRLVPVRSTTHAKIAGPRIPAYHSHVPKKPTRANRAAEPQACEQTLNRSAGHRTSTSELGQNVRRATHSRSSESTTM